MTTASDNLRLGIRTEKPHFALMTSNQIRTNSFLPCKFKQFYTMKVSSFDQSQTSTNIKISLKIISKNSSCGQSFSWASGTRSQFVFV